MGKKKQVKERQIKEIAIYITQENGGCEEVKQNQSDWEHRRTTRLGAILAIIAVIGALGTIVLKLTMGFLNIWSQNGFIYWYFQTLFSMTLSMIVIMVINIVQFVLADLRRYNILDCNYKHYDEKSDAAYLLLLSDFKIYIRILFILFTLIIPLSVLYSEKSQRWIGIMVSGVLIVAVAILFIDWIRHKSIEEIKQGVVPVWIKIAKLVFTGLICYIVGTAFVINGKETIHINYSTNGYVEIDNTSSTNYDELKIEIFDKNDKLIYNESINKSKLLFAREEKYIINEVDENKIVEGLSLGSELLHWKYVFDLASKVEDVGQYYIAITVNQGTKRVVVENMFNVVNNDYTFAKSSIDKDY